MQPDIANPKHAPPTSLNILAAIGLGPRSRDVVAWVLALAPPGARVTLLHVADVHPGPYASWPTQARERFQRGSQELDHARSVLHKSGVEVGAMFGPGQPLHQILDLAQEARSELIIAGAPTTDEPRIGLALIEKTPTDLLLVAGPPPPARVFLAGEYPPPRSSVGIVVSQRYGVPATPLPTRSLPGQHEPYVIARANSPM